MNTSTPPIRTKVPITYIEINQAEGLIDRLVKARVSTWAAANVLLARICSEAPKDGSYLKVDFKIHWSDSETYIGRFDASHPEYKNHDPADLALHVRNYAEYLAGFRCPKHLDQATYEHQLAVGEKAKPGRGEEARKFLMTRSLKDDPNAKPATIEKNDRPRVVDVPLPLSPAAKLNARLQTIETQITVVLSDLTAQLPILMATKTADRASDVAAYAKARAQELELRKALAAVIKARS
jgi:hypothetical protein